MVQKSKGLGWRGLRINIEEDRSDCEGAKYGEFKKLGGGVDVFGKRINKYVSNIALGI